MSNTKPMYQLVAVDDDKKVVQMLNQDSDHDFLEKIADARDGMIWIGSNLYDLKVVSA